MECASDLGPKWSPQALAALFSKLWVPYSVSAHPEGLSPDIRTAGFLIMVSCGELWLVMVNHGESPDLVTKNGGIPSSLDGFWWKNPKKIMDDDWGYPRHVWKPRYTEVKKSQKHISMDGVKGKSTGNHSLVPWNMGFSCEFSLKAILLDDLAGSMWTGGYGLPINIY